MQTDVLFWKTLVFDGVDDVDVETTAFNSGINEGCITDLRLQKRIMAGRAGVPLLRLEVRRGEQASSRPRSRAAFIFKTKLSPVPQSQ
jgi:hypothetical protein